MIVLVGLICRRRLDPCRSCLLPPRGASSLGWRAISAPAPKHPRTRRRVKQYARLLDTRDQSHQVTEYLVSQLLGIGTRYHVLGLMMFEFAIACSSMQPL